MTGHAWRNLLEVSLSHFKATARFKIVQKTKVRFKPKAPKVFFFSYFFVAKIQVIPQK